MSIDSRTTSPATPDKLRPEAGDPPPAFNERALLAHYVLRDFDRAVDDVEKELRGGNNPATTGQDGTEDEAAVKARRDLACQIVTGAWLNRNNPGWDPARPETHRPDPQDPLLAILKGLDVPAT